MDDQNDVVKDYLANGVDIPELKEEETPEAPKEEPKEEAPKVPEAPTVKTEEAEPLKEKEEEPVKRSIYDEYKDKKSELRQTREELERIAQERDELKAKLEAVAQAGTVQEKKDAQDDLAAFAQEIGADPEAIRKMRDLFLKDAKPQIDESISRDLEEFKSWKEQHAKALEKQHFEEEFNSIVPELKSQFPNASDEEIGQMKAKLDEISHTKDFHDKSLDYVAYKHREVLGALVSPKKAGLERKGKVDVEDKDSFEFDPNADISTMSGKQLEKWEAEYKKMAQSNGLLEDSQGRKVII